MAERWLLMSVIAVVTIEWEIKLFIFHRVSSFGHVADHYNDGKSVRLHCDRCNCLLLLS